MFLLPKYITRSQTNWNQCLNMYKIIFFYVFAGVGPTCLPSVWINQLFLSMTSTYLISRNTMIWQIMLSNPTFFGQNQKARVPTEARLHHRAKPIGWISKTRQQEEVGNTVACPKKPLVHQPCCTFVSKNLNKWIYVH